MNDLSTPNYSKKEADLSGLKHPSEYLEFIHWIATPDEFREPKTQRELAEKFGVGEDVLSDWKKRDGFWEEVKRKIRSWGQDKMPDILDALYREITKTGRAAEVKLWLQYVEGWSEKVETKSTGTVRQYIIIRGSEETAKTLDLQEKNGIIES